VNVGGSEYFDANGNTWMADRGYSGGLSRIDSEAIGNTRDGELYRTARTTDGALSYSFAVQPGTRTITLKFADSTNAAPGDRLMDIAINGQTVAAGFDIIAAAGGPRLAADRTFAAQSNGSITITLTASVGQVTLSAIEIR